MLNDAVIFSGCFLVISSLLLFALGHRLALAHWAASQLIALGTTGAAPPLLDTLVAAVLLTSLIATACPDWTSIAHVTFAAAICTVVTFLAYATYVLVEAKLGPSSETWR